MKSSLWKYGAVGVAAAGLTVALTLLLLDVAERKQARWSRPSWDYGSTWARRRKWLKRSARLAKT